MWSSVCGAFYFPDFTLMFGKLQRKSGGKNTNTFNFPPFNIKDCIWVPWRTETPICARHTFNINIFFEKKQNKQKTPQEFEKLHLQGLD